MHTLESQSNTSWPNTQNANDTTRVLVSQSNSKQMTIEAIELAAAATWTGTSTSTEIEITQTAVYVSTQQ